MPIPEALPEEAVRRILFTMAMLALAPAAAAQDIESLERALEKARLEAPLALRPFVVLAKPARYYGDYEQRRDTTFARGETMYFYFEPKNLVIVKNPQGLFEPAFEVDLEVQPPKSAPVRKPAYVTFRLPGRSRVQDFFVNLALPLGDAQPGVYNVRFMVRDLNSSKTARIDQSVTVK